MEVEQFIEEFQRRRSSVLSAGSKNSIRCTNRLTTARTLSLRITNSWSPAKLFKLKTLEKNLNLTFLFIEDQSELLKKLQQQAEMDDVLPEGSDSQNGDTGQDAVENPSQDENNDLIEASTESQLINELVAETSTTEETVTGMC